MGLDGWINQCERKNQNEHTIDLSWTASEWENDGKDREKCQTVLIERQFNMVVKYDSVHGIYILTHL